MESKIAQFASEVMDIELTERQVSIIEAVANGKTVAPPPNKLQLNIANKVMRAYLNDGLTEATKAPARKYWYKVTPGLIDILLIMLDYVHEKNQNAFTWKEVRDRLKSFQQTHNSKLRFHGLIAKVKDDKGRHTGEWVITRRAAEFLRGEIAIPAKVLTCNNRVIGYDDNNVTVRDVYGSDPYLQGSADFINTPLPSSKAQRYEPGTVGEALEQKALHRD